MIVHKTLESHAPQCWTACTDMCLSLAVLSLSVQSVGNVLMTCGALQSKQKTQEDVLQELGTATCFTVQMFARRLLGHISCRLEKRFPQYPFHVSVCLEKTQNRHIRAHMTACLG